MTLKELLLPSFIYKEHFFKVMDFKLGLNSKIMNTIFQQVERMLCHYSRVILVRVDLPMDQLTNTNHQLTCLFKQLKYHVKQTYRSLLGYVWVREQNRAEAQHYHVLLLLNGHKIFYPYRLVANLRAFWNKLVGKYPYIPKHCFYKLYRENLQSLKAPIYRTSYLAKKYSKGNRPVQTKDYGASRLKAGNPYKSPFKNDHLIY